jgi:hypothetical protein
MRNNGKGNEAGGRSSGHNAGGSSHGGARNKASDRDRTKSGHGRSSESTSTGKQSAREPPPCPNTNKCAGEKHFLSGCPDTGKNDAIALLSEYKKERDANKKKANFKTLGNNGATSENKGGQTAYLTAENLGVKVTVLAETGSGHSAIPRSAVEDAKKRGFPLKVEVLPEPVMLSMAIRGEGDKQTCSATDNCRRKYGPPVDRMTGLGRDGFRGKSVSGLCAGQIPPARLHPHWRGAIEAGQAAFGRPVKASTHARSHSRVY